MNNEFKRLISELNTIKRQLSEDYMFGDREEGMHRPPMEDEEPMEGGVDPMMGRHQPNEMEQGDNEEEKAMHAQEVIKHEPIIAKIRETAIEGLKKYSDYPTSSLYEFFKKVFLESDKVLTDNGAKK